MKMLKFGFFTCAFALYLAPYASAMEQAESKNNAPTTVEQPLEDSEHALKKAIEVLVVEEPQNNGGGMLSRLFTVANPLNWGFSFWGSDERKPQVPEVVVESHKSAMCFNFDDDARITYPNFIQDDSKQLLLRVSEQESHIITPENVYCLFHGVLLPNPKADKKEDRARAATLWHYIIIRLQEAADVEFVNMVTPSQSTFNNHFSCSFETIKLNDIDLIAEIKELGIVFDASVRGIQLTKKQFKKMSVSFENIAKFVAEHTAK